MIPKDLNKKAWYRLLKVLYFFALFIALLFALAVAWVEAVDLAYANIDVGIGDWAFLLGAVVAMIAGILLAAEIIKRAFYYVVLGKMFFKKEMPPNER